MQEAIRAHAQGRFATAQGIYAEILKIQPRHFQALHLLGRSYGQSGHFDKAADFLGKAVGVNPHDAVAHTDRGTALKALRRFDEALAARSSWALVAPDDARGAAHVRG